MILPPASLVRGKVIFSQVSVCPWGFLSDQVLSGGRGHPWSCPGPVWPSPVQPSPVWGEGTPGHVQVLSDQVLSNLVLSGERGYPRQNLGYCPPIEQDQVYTPPRTLRHGPLSIILVLFDARSKLDFFETHLEWTLLSISLNTPLIEVFSSNMYPCLRLSDVEVSGVRGMPVLFVFTIKRSSNGTLGRVFDDGYLETWGCGARDVR